MIIEELSKLNLTYWLIQKNLDPSIIDGINYAWLSLFSFQGSEAQDAQMPTFQQDVEFLVGLPYEKASVDYATGCCVLID